MRANPHIPPFLLSLALLATGASAELVELPVATGNDDAEEASGGGVSLTGSDLELVLDASLQTVGLRWTGIPIPVGYVVTAAWVQFRSDETSSGDASLVLQGEASTNAAPFTTAAGSLSSRPRTAQSVAWSPPTWDSVNEVGPDQRTPDLSALIQAVVDRPGWASGNALALIVTGSGRRTADPVEGGFPPVLHLEFEPPDNFAPQLSLVSPAGTDVFSEDEPVLFSATATDVEEGDLSNRVAFATDIEGLLGFGSPLLHPGLSEGYHQLTAWVTDRRGKTTIQTAQILVTSGPPRIVAAGDMTACNHERDQETGLLLDGLDGIVLTMGDNAYPDGTAQEFASCYEPSWGRHRERTRPSPGNHDFHVPGGAGYFGYFGAAAGSGPEGWYSFDYGGWHFVALNSNCSAIGGCTRTSPQGQWLEADLDANPSRCTLAYWHHARFCSSTNHGSITATRDLWAILQEHAADVVLVGHDHLYERFAPQNADGVADPLGIREFVVGTGGAGLYSHGTPEPNSEVRDNTSYGVLSLDLAPDGYAWEFHPATILGGTFTDNGVASCVVLPPSVSIEAPAPGSVFSGDAEIAFAGTASDPEEGDVGATLIWTSDKDGVLGSGPAFTNATLSCGTHVVTASASDEEGGIGQGKRRFQIGPAGCPGSFGCGLGPELTLLLGGLWLASGLRRGGWRPRRTR